jgi:hypothetical protein
MAAFRQPAGEAIIWQWPADMKALCGIATQVIQHIPGQAIFNTLSHHLVTKVVPKVYN